MAAKKGNKKKTVKSKDNTDGIATNSSLLSSAIPGIILAIIAAAALWSPRSDSNSSAQDSSSSTISYQEDDNVDRFFAWTTPPPDDKLQLLKALFPNLTEFQNAYESHPLLSRVSFAVDQPTTLSSYSNDENTIPTILHNRESISNINLGYSGDVITSLFTVDDTGIVLSEQPMKHGDDYRMTKKIIMPPGDPNEGEEYNGMIPGDTFTFNDIMYAFWNGGFSVVINRMQKRWGAIANLAQQMEEEFGEIQVGVNLYLTPHVVMETEQDRENGEVRQGFENHWDWMDVIIIQVSGRKRWSVASEPAIYLSEKDRKFKPTNKQASSFQRYDTFTLCPGDVLYIPRGHIHNASTVLFDDLFGQEDEKNGDASEVALDLDRCPDYPKDNPLAQVLQSRVIGPSLHLTFGVGLGCEKTVESLLHHALNEFFAIAENLPSGMTKDKVAIPSRTLCQGGEKRTKYSLKWRAVMHHALAEVARRQHPCDGIMNPDSEHPENCNTGTTILRKSVPLLLLEDNKLLTGEHTQLPKQMEQQLKDLEDTYLLAVNRFVTLASIPKMVDWILNLIKAQSNADSSDAKEFFYPGYAKDDIIVCPELLKTLSDKTFVQLLQSFNKFATEDSFNKALKALNLRGKGRRDDIRRLQRANLEKYGQLIAK